MFKLKHIFCKKNISTFFFVSVISVYLCYRVINRWTDFLEINTWVTFPTRCKYSSTLHSPS